MNFSIVKGKVQYYNLKKLNFKVIRNKDDGFYKMTSNVVNRSLSWKNEVILSQSTVFDLGELLVLSRVHFRDCRIMSIKLEISEHLNGPFIDIFARIIVVSGGIKVIKIGNLPARYFRVTVIKGSQLQDFSKVECFGMKFLDMEKQYDDSEMDLLVFNPYKFIYKKDIGKSECKSEKQSV